MIRLWVVELRRFVSRRLFRWLSVLALCAFVLAGTISFATSQPPSAAELRRHERQVRRCIKNLERFDAGALPPGALESGRGTPPDVEDPESFCRDNTFSGDGRFAYRDMRWVVGSIGIPLLMLGWLLGASFIGAEFTSRSLTQTLTWEPRRVRLLSAKAAAAAATTFVWTAILLVLFSLAMYPTARFRGTTAGLDGAWFADYVAQLLRIAGAAAVGSTLGFSLATIGRNTAAALGAGFVYLAVVESLIRQFRPSWIDWLIGDNLVMWIVGEEGIPLGHSQKAAALVLLAYAAVALVAAAAVMRRREVA